MKWTSLWLACAAVSIAFPQFSGPYLPDGIYVVHAATRRSPRTPDAAIARGSLVDITILGLYPPSGSLAAGEPVTLYFRGPGATDARELAVVNTLGSFDGTPVAFTARVPVDTASGQGELIARAASGRSFSAPVWIGESGFGIFTKSNGGYDAALAQVWRDPPSLAGLTNPVRAGDWVTLWGTGLGTARSATIDVGSILAEASYAGPAPGLPGVDQINFQFPAGVSDDCYIPITVTAGGRESNTPSLATASAPGPCPHRLGLSAAALATLDQNGRVPLSQTWVHGDAIALPDDRDRYRRYDTVTLNFIQYDAAGVQVVTGQRSVPSSGCRVSAGGLTAAAFLNVQPLDAGRPVVTGPGDVRLEMEGEFGHYSTPPSESTYALEDLPASSLTPGDWAVEVPGGRTVAAFRAALRVPPPLRWTNRATVSPVSRSSGLRLEWDPTGYTDRERMQGSLGIGASAVICSGPATAGSFTIPASLIAQLPVSSTSTPMVQLLLTPVNDQPQRYSVPLVEGGAFPGVATFSYLEMVTVEIR